MTQTHVSQDYITARASTVAIGTSYDASPTALRIQNWNQLQLYCDLFLATATDVRVKVEFAVPQGNDTPVAADWYFHSYLDTAAATGTGLTKAVPLLQTEWIMSATGRYVISLPVNAKWFRVTAKTTAGPGLTTLKILATQGIV